MKGWVPRKEIEMRGFVVAGTILVGLGACATPAPLQPPAVSGPAAALTLERGSSPVGALASYTVLVDAVPVVGIRNGETKTVRVPAGQRVVTLDCGGAGMLRTVGQTSLPFEEGRRYRLQVINGVAVPCALVLAGIE